MSIKSGKVGLRSDGDYDYEIYWLECNNCGNSMFSNDYITDFMRVVELKKTIAKQNGWICKKYVNSWADICPRCNKLKEKSN